MLPIIIGGAAVAALVVAKGRPSTLFRLAEDGVVSVGRGVARSTSRFVHKVDIEMQARQLARGRRNVERQAARLKSMSAAQRAQLDADTAEIIKRANELKK